MCYRLQHAPICRDIVPPASSLHGGRGQERGLQGAGLQARTLLGMYRRKVGVFGGLV